MAAKILSALVASGFLFTAVNALAHDYKIGDLEIHHPWARASATSGAKAGAAFLDIKNNGTSDAYLLSAASDISKRVELHTHNMDENGVMRMREVAKITIPAGETVRLQPGGLHVMFMGLTSPLKKGESFDMTLNFDQEGSLPVNVHIGGVAQGSSHSH